MTVAVSVAVSAAGWRPWTQGEGGEPGALVVEAGGGGGHWVREPTDLRKKPPVQPWLEGGELHLALGKERM